MIRRRSLKQYRTYLIFLAGIVLAMPAFSRVWLTPTALTQDFLWNGGDIDVAVEGCVQSTSAGGPNGGAVLPYEVVVATPFFLQSVANQIPAVLEWTDLTNGSVVPLVFNTSTGQIFTGSLDQTCGGGNNYRFRVRVAAAQIYAVPPGLYTQTFTATVSNAGQGPNNRPLNVTINLTLPDSIRVSQLNDIDLGMYTGTDKLATESLCVFRSSGGTYAVTATGSGAGGAYLLQNGASTIPFSVSWDDGTGPAQMTPGVPLPGRLNSFTQSDTCNNGANNNASLMLSLLAADMDAAPVSGQHSGVITITVGME